MRIAQVHHGRAHMVPIRNGLQFLNVHRIPREVDRVGEPVAASTETLTGNNEPRAFIPWDVLGWCCDDLEFPAADGMLEFGPGFHAVDGWAGRKVSCAIRGGVDAAAIQELPAEIVEVVWVVFVAEQDSVDDGELVQAEGWVVCDLEDYDAPVPGGAGGREEGVGEEVYPVDFEDGSGCADVGDVESGRHGSYKNKLVKVK